MLAFVHIPKTAGTTLHKIITHQYSQVFIHHDSDEVPGSILAERMRERKPQVVMGHFSVGLHEFLPDLRYITCLREPVARILSHYQHALNDSTHYLHQHVVSGNLDPAEYTSSGLSGELSNGMTRMLAGVRDFHHTTVDAETLALAKSNIESFFDGVILSELFDPGLLMLADSLHWKTPYYVRRKIGHYGSAPRQPDARTRAVIEEHNRFDCELHEWAKQRFENQQAASPGLAKRSLLFQQANRIKGKGVFCLRELRMRLDRSSRQP